MFLKSLTLRGFKSFPDKTELVFEPGITVVVGPNGSGKSNIVDALSWVLGTHSAKSLRGGQMADVIFAGSPHKPALGRASVEIAIDNTAGTLPIEFSEVTVSRAMFATGENTYAINGVECRLLDVQELLSDTGLGREHHTIVGQGQIDAILNAKPEERRAFIEEAAGILKHRRRKERALRKLGQMDAHVERLTDVLRELRRNLRPLERQAEAAAKHADLQDQLNEVRRTLAVRELNVLAERWEHEETAQSASDERLTELESGLRLVRTEEAEIEGVLTELAPAARTATETHFRLSNLVERLRGLVERISERRSGLIEAVEEPVAGRDPEQLRAEAENQRTALDELAAEQEAADAELSAAEQDRQTAEHARRAHEQAAAAEARRRVEARERVLRWEGEVAALRSSLAQAASEEGRLASQVTGLESRRAELENDVESVQHDIQRLDAAEVTLAEQLAAAEAVLERRQATAHEAAMHERELERQRASLEARADALRAASQEATEGIAALAAAAEAGEVGGVIGPLADHLQVVGGMAKAVAAALGSLGDALVVDSRRAAADAVGFVRSRKSGRVLLVAAATARPDRPEELDQELADVGARPLVESLRGDEQVLAALHTALAGVYAVADFDAACRLAGHYPQLVFVTADGELAGARGYAGGSAAPSSAVLSRAAAEQAEAKLEIVADELLRAHRQLADADRELEAARRELDAATAAMQESDALITGGAERLKRLRKELDTCEAEVAILHGQQADLTTEIRSQQERLAALETRGPARPAPEGSAEAADLEDPRDDDGPDLEAERLEDELTRAREAEVQARLAASAVTQRRDELDRRIAALEQEARDVEQALAEREQRRHQRLAGIARCGELAEVADAALRRAETSLATAAAERDRFEEQRARHQSQLGVVRSRLREVEEELAGARDERHGEDLRRQELRHELDTVRARLTELGADPDEALAAAREDEKALTGGAKRDEALAESEAKLVRKIGLLGTINPLAVEEFNALQERQAFLTEQLEDLRASRRDLLEVVDKVDERIRDVFAAAFADVAAQFEAVFPRLFPGGSGKLELTDPDNLLETGIEVEARLPGKKVKRLSLLSGGERSLTALAVLFAIFAARPSPFYVLDEVEAALDDVNLQRFLTVLHDFRESSQLIVVTHQRRTMEVADSLYGISMQGNGVSKVISQRMSSPAPASA